MAKIKLSLPGSADVTTLVRRWRPIIVVGESRSVSAAAAITVEHVALRTSV